MLRIKNTYFLIFFLFFAITLSSSQCFASIKIIRDTEIESVIYKIAQPLLETAKLNKEVQIFIVADLGVNAFVTDGKKIFINSGLIQKFPDYELIAGVIAHEIGHIKSGHLVQGYENNKNINNIALYSYLLGLGALIGGSSDAGQAIISSGISFATSNYLKYTRSQEESADSIAIELLSCNNIEKKGLLMLLDYFRKQTTAQEQYSSQYQNSHPISIKRIEFIKHKNKANSCNNVLKNNAQDINFLLKMASSKLEAFSINSQIIKNLDPPGSYFASNREKLPIKEALSKDYKESIMLYRVGRIEESLDKLKSIKKILHNNEFFIDELIGQILFESGNFIEAKKYYNLALNGFKASEFSKIIPSLELLLNIENANNNIKIIQSENAIDDSFIKKLVDENILFLNGIKITKKHMEDFGAEPFKTLALSYYYKKDLNNYFFCLAYYFFNKENYKVARYNFLQAKTFIKKDLDKIKAKSGDSVEDSLELLQQKLDLVDYFLLEIKSLEIKSP
jgi:predicted Zn-dependent protease